MSNNPLKASSNSGHSVDESVVVIDKSLDRSLMSLIRSDVVVLGA